MEQLNNLQSNKKNIPAFWVVVVSIVVTALLVGGGVFLWQKSINLSLKQELEKKISYLQERVLQSDERISDLEIQIPKMEVEQGKQTMIEKTGRIYVFGNEPFTNIGLEVEGEQTYCLVGPLENELINNYQGKTSTVKGIIVSGFCSSGGKTIKVISVK